MPVATEATLTKRNVKASSSGSAAAASSQQASTSAQAKQLASSSSSSMKSDDMQLANFNLAGFRTLLVIVILSCICITGFMVRLFSVIRYESIIHEFDPW